MLISEGIAFTPNKGVRPHHPPLRDMAARRSLSLPPSTCSISRRPLGVRARSLPVTALVLQVDFVDLVAEVPAMSCRGLLSCRDRRPAAIDAQRERVGDDQDAPGPCEGR